ncbi:receptor kinase-like protein Xa21 [Coffea arabica]|uniref:Receptor kinase-like protein Xa21 n=1 Tax=Coffea arabica TaxID=13443 RepID=A0ABM4VCF3_COFAR
MENGNLDLWLHPSDTTDQATSSRSLNLLQKLNIAIDVASALQYLHDHCEDEIVHCDLKPSNILLDNDLVAHVGDFGLARLLPKPVNTSSEQGTSSTIAIKGTIGYAAPVLLLLPNNNMSRNKISEYGMGLGASTQGDVYSYGILLLEMLTGRRPTDDIFVGDLNLHNYVNGALHEQVSETMNPLLFLEGDENRKITPGGKNSNGGKEMECIISLLKIGLKCSARLPNDRMHMNEVVRKLHVIKDVLLGLRLLTGLNHQDEVASSMN